MFVMIHQTYKEIKHNATLKGKRGIRWLFYVSHQILKELFGEFYEFLCNCGICKAKIIVYVDGGIFSQIRKYLIGQIYAQQGISVGYDLSWYKGKSMDVDNKYPRYYEIEQMFQGLKLNTFGSLTTYFYRTFLSYSFSFSEVPPISSHEIAPIYLGGYPNMSYDILYSQFRKSLLGLKLSNVSKKITKENEKQLNCAVHVRRGDLAKGDNVWYGGVTDDYFFRAINYVTRHNTSVKFIFFSDEMEYVKSNLLPKINVDYELIEGNKAFEDLILISSCDIVIASQGSFGKMGAIMNEKSLLILQNDKYAERYLTRPNTIAI